MIEAAPACSTRPRRSASASAAAEDARQQA
jgi:hypothetical protein